MMGEFRFLHQGICGLLCNRLCSSLAGWFVADVSR